MHPAIQANIDYWREAARLLPFGKPDHVTHYIVKENGDLRCYAIKWNGNNLDNHTLVTGLPDGIVNEAITSLNGFSPIGSTEKLNGKELVVQCWIHSGPVREMDYWLPSFAGSLIENEMPAPITFVTKWLEEGRVEA